MEEPCIDPLDPIESIDLSEVESLIKLVESRGLSELVVREDGLKITIRGAGYTHQYRAASATSTLVDEAPSAQESLYDLTDAFEEYEPPIEVPERFAVSSPMVGVFYRSSGPDTGPYVETGDHLDVGQIIGLIEAMKVFSEVPSEVSGTVIEFASPNGQLVRTGDPLIYLTPD